MKLDSKTIILIDDNYTETFLIKEAIKEVDGAYDLHTFHDPEIALNYITEHAKNIGIIICDINMPKMTGIELLEKIYKDDNLRLAAVPFIFLSNSATEKEVRTAYKLSAQGYFQKPYDLNELARILKTIIDYWQLAKIPSNF